MSIVVAMDADIKRSYVGTQTIWDAGIKSYMVSENTRKIIKHGKRKRREKYYSRRRAKETKNMSL